MKTSEGQFRQGQWRFLSNLGCMESTVIRDRGSWTEVARYDKTFEVQCPRWYIQLPTHSCQVRPR
jgi:hypothetical protein